MSHTYSVIRTNSYEWTGNPNDVFYVECNCGIASGMTHSTIESAHREPIHTDKINSRRRLAPAVWDGEVVCKVTKCTDCKSDKLARQDDTVYCTRCRLILGIDPERNIDAPEDWTCGHCGWAELGDGCVCPTPATDHDCHCIELTLMSAPDQEPSVSA